MSARGSTPTIDGAGVRRGAPSGAGGANARAPTRDVWGVAVALVSAPAEVGRSNDNRVTSAPASHALPPVPTLAPRRRRHTSRTNWQKKTSQNAARATRRTRTNAPSSCRCVRCHLVTTTYGSRTK